MLNQEVTLEPGLVFKGKLALLELVSRDTQDPHIMVQLSFRGVGDPPKPLKFSAYWLDDFIITLQEAKMVIDQQAAIDPRFHARHQNFP